jgi:hypothetical protein
VYPCYFDCKPATVQFKRRLTVIKKDWREKKQGDYQKIDFDVRPDWYDVALPLLSPELRERVESGELYIREPKIWKHDDKPVLITRDYKMVKGSGQMVGAVDKGNPALPYQARAGYRRLMEDLLPANTVRDNKHAIMSFKELVEHLIDACLGTPQVVRCTNCGDKFQTAFKKDAATLYKVFENLNGKAKETQEINLSSQHLAVVLNERTPVENVQVRVLEQSEIDERKKMVIEHE